MLLLPQCLDYVGARAQPTALAQEKALLSCPHHPAICHPIHLLSPRNAHPRQLKWCTGLGISWENVRPVEERGGSEIATVRTMGTTQICPFTWKALLGSCRGEGGADGPWESGGVGEGPYVLPPGTQVLFAPS